ncbi:diguanylate cyclase (GGDEF) domain-containing protein [Dethiosulfatibacter aminovorans DSM 17477]|uniref:Diguanylate cyclase (GGDEF) domain-containing protein n=1 Tax=Dethiosulfatibacter aminovorans DSM 17477 TaxID=1121476 RepID=A0A1M6E713_9FIRM|nr:HD domain-containing protein [Dethiosulfatibacter aminovorans]SHI81150.1 diguanylate cyclase (GGDEF) domain-containing protein [Dethiosulfatibacter aminovorans DSM 17477]
MNRFNVLLVENNNYDIAIISEKLRKTCRCNIYTCSNGNEALDLMSQKDLNIILVNLDLPDFKGYDFIESMKSIYRTSTIPVIAISNKPLTPEEKKKGYRLDILDFLIKPFDAEELLDDIYRFINSSRIVSKLTEELTSINDELRMQNIVLTNAYKKIEHLTFHDSLTSCYNRSYFDNLIDIGALMDSLPVSIIMADMNNLKLINDAFGHHKGDQLIKDAAEYLIRNFRDEDIVIRWGGDEFLILMPNTSYRIAQKIISRVGDKYFKVSTDFLKPHMAVGLSTFENEVDSISDAIKTAENRMYRNKMMDNKSYRSSIVDSLTNSLLEKDYESMKHTQRVAEIVMKIANKMDMTIAEKDELLLLAKLHDIGKLAVPEKILLKGERLTDEEWAAVKKHPLNGYNICKTIPELLPIAESILAHHEWWNGEGYPQGLRYKEIPLLARIISIADAYDVMTNSSSYRKAISHDEAIEELKRFAGTQFDPNLLKIFVNCCANDVKDLNRITG